MSKKSYIIRCDFYSKKPSVKSMGPTTLAIVEEYEETPITVYLRNYDDAATPRLNVKQLAMRLTSKKKAEQIAKELTEKSFDEGKIKAIVEIA